VTVELRPETELLVEEEFRRGRFHSVDELIAYAIRTLREKDQSLACAETTVERRRPAGKKSLAQLFAESPFRGMAMDFERFPDSLRAGDL
jgi:Arc/MetJ-type ribon-helix-helix transcriptional regulator